MLSEEVRKELDKYNQGKKSSYKSAHPRVTKVHQQDHDDDDNPDNPEADLDNHNPDDLYPMQDPDTDEVLETHGHYSAKTLSSYRISKHSASS